MKFCLADVFPKKWDILTVENISVGGAKFLALSDWKLDDKVIQLQIKIPELAPHFLELEARVLSATPRSNSKICDVRVKFINLSETDKERLSVIEEIINLQEIKNAKKNPDKNK